MAMSQIQVMLKRKCTTILISILILQPLLPVNTPDFQYRNHKSHTDLNMLMITSKKQRTRVAYQNLLSALAIHGQVMFVTEAVLERNLRANANIVSKIADVQHAKTLITMSGAVPTKTTNLSYTNIIPLGESSHFRIFMSARYQRLEKHPYRPDLLPLYHHILKVHSSNRSLSRVQSRIRRRSRYHQQVLYWRKCLASLPRRGQL